MAARSATIAESGTVQPDWELLRLADLSLAEFLRHLARFGGCIHEQDGLLLFRGAHSQPNPYRNGLIRLDEQLPPDEVVLRADEFFSVRRSGYVAWTREHGDAALESLVARRAVRDLERLPELVLDELPADLGSPPGVELRRADDPAIRVDYLRVVADAWGFGSMPLELAAKVFFDPESVDAANVVAFVAYHDGHPLSGAMTLVTHGVALGCQAATIRRPKPGQRLPRPDPHARGLAESCLFASLQVAFEELGATRSLCQTSAAGEPVWRKFGYRPLTSYGRYLRCPRGARECTRTGPRRPCGSRRRAAAAVRVGRLVRAAGADRRAGGQLGAGRVSARRMAALRAARPPGHAGADRSTAVAGATATTIAVALEALGYGCTDNGLIFSLNAQMWACETPIAALRDRGAEAALSAGPVRRLAHRGPRR